MELQKRIINTVIQRLIDEESRIASQWHEPHGTKTKYFILDNLLTEELATEIHAAFQNAALAFVNRSSFRERKRTLAKLNYCPPILAAVTYALQNQTVIRKISELTEINDLEGDSNLYAGGLSMMSRGDFLNPHIDNSHDSHRKLYRRLNALYYVTPDWQEEFGGNLELWDENVEQPMTIWSRFNRLVVMETNKSSWHSVSPVIEEANRCCVSNYYFSNSSPDETDYFHVTSFTGRPTESLRRSLGSLDNVLRNFIAEKFKVVSGQKFMSKD